MIDEVVVIWNTLWFTWLGHPKSKSILALEGTARYAGLLLAPAEGSGRGRGFFFTFGKKKTFFMPIFAYLRPFLVLCSKLSNF